MARRALAMPGDPDQLRHRALFSPCTAARAIDLLARIGLWLRALPVDRLRAVDMQMLGDRVFHQAHSKWRAAPATTARLTGRRGMQTPLAGRHSSKRHEPERRYKSARNSGPADRVSDSAAHQNGISSLRSSLAGACRSRLPPPSPPPPALFASSMVSSPR